MKIPTEIYRASSSSSSSSLDDSAGSFTFSEDSLQSYDEESNEGQLLDVIGDLSSHSLLVKTSMREKSRHVLLTELISDENNNLLDLSFTNVDTTIALSRSPTPEPTKAQPIPLTPPGSTFLQTHQLSMTTDLFDEYPSTLGGPIPMRRVSSTPVSIRPSTTFHTHRRSMLHSPRIPRTELNTASSEFHDTVKPWDPLLTPHALNRQLSLPVTSYEQTPPRTRLRKLKTTDSEFSIEDFIPESDLENLAKELARPTRRKLPKVDIFRSTQSPTHSLNPQGNATSCSFDERRLPFSTVPSSTIQMDRGTDKLQSFEMDDMTQQECTTHTTTNRKKLSSIKPSNSNQLQSTFHQEKPSLQPQNWHYIAYLSTFAIFGSILRVYVGRFFGLDCEFPDRDLDFLSPLSKNICVTVSGKSIQTGGALFTDLPANMIGSFIMGLMVNLRPDLWPPIPWLRENHPLQQYEPLHVAIKTGFCGSLTSFSSWNTQMVVMMDGTQTELGKQIIPAIFGYILGLMAAICSFLFGTHVSAWMNQHRNSHRSPQFDGLNNDDTSMVVIEERIWDQENGTKSSNQEELPRTDVCLALTTSSPICRCLGSMVTGKSIAFSFLVALFAALLIGDILMSNLFYRSLWLAALMTPPGALLRWQLSKWNGRWSVMGRCHWVPWGTLLCNLIASIVCILFLAIEIRHNRKKSSDSLWGVAILGAIRAGFTGSLSTVSTFVKEIVDLNNNYQQHAKCYIYAALTIVLSAIFSLLTYCPIVWS